MSGPERGPLRSYEIQWQSGHVETIRAHQVSWPNGFTVPGEVAGPPFIRFMGEIDGQWTLVLQALETDIRAVRDVTQAERIEGVE